MFAYCQYDCNHDFTKEDLLGQTLKNAKYIIENNFIYYNKINEGFLIDEIVEIICNGKETYNDEYKWWPKNNSLTLLVETKDNKIIGFVNEK